MRACLVGFLRLARKALARKRRGTPARRSVPKRSVNGAIPLARRWAIKNPPPPTGREDTRARYNRSPRQLLPAQPSEPLFGGRADREAQRAISDMGIHRKHL